MSVCVKFLLKNAMRQVSIDIQLTSPSNRQMTTHDRARYHDFYRRHRFAWTKRKGGWDVGSPGSKSIRSVVFGYLFFFHTFVSHTKQQCCKNGGLSRSVSRSWNGKSQHFWDFEVLPINLDEPLTSFPCRRNVEALRHAEILAMGTAGNPREYGTIPDWGL